MQSTKVLDSFLGLCIGDALGVPVEFSIRQELKSNPVTGMREYGSHNQPAGTWSDDSSLAFCLAESLCQGYDLNAIAQNFVKWYKESHWTPHGRVFDIGIATSHSLHKLATGTSPLTSGGIREKDNGNGSLMRILPILFYLKNLPIKKRFEVIGEVSGITHGHIRSIFACFIYCEYALQLLNGAEKRQAFQAMQHGVKLFVKEYAVIGEEELNRFHRLLENPVGAYDIRPLDQYQESEIASSGYVLDTLEASLWCFLKTNTYAEAVLKAVNLGGDTDTTGCVTGGIAGLYYGIGQIPPQWIEVVARKEEVMALAQRLYQRYN